MVVEAGNAKLLTQAFNSPLSDIKGFECTGGFYKVLRVFEKQPRGQWNVMNFAACSEKV